MFYRNTQEFVIGNYIVEVDICEDAPKVLTIDFSTISAEGAYIKNTGAANIFAVSEIREIFASIFSMVKEAQEAGYKKFVANATDEKRRSLYKKVCQRAGFVIGGNTGEFAFYFTTLVEKEAPVRSARRDERKKRALIRQIMLDIGEPLPEANASVEVWEAFYAANAYLADHF